MKNTKILEGTPNLKTVKLVDSNLWMEPSTKLEDVAFWTHRFVAQKVPFVLAQYDTELTNERKEKMYRRVYGIFIDMKRWEKENA